MTRKLSNSRKMTGRALIPFLALTFSLTWGIAAMLILFYDQVSAIFGELTMSNPLYILAVYSPAIVGILMVGRYYGLEGLGRFFKRMTQVRAPAKWWLFLVLGIPAVVYTAATIKGSINDPFPFTSVSALLSGLGLALLLGPIEEFGWRGVALPLLQRRFAPVWSGLILGVIIAVWHLPAFLLSGSPLSNWSVVPYFGGVIAIYVIMTAFFNESKGSLLIAYLFHFQLMNPIFPDAQPYDNLMWIAIAVVIVIVNRKKMFNRDYGFTEIVEDPAESEAVEQAYSMA